MIDPLNSLTSQDIRIAIQNCTGPRPSLFVPELAFESLIKPQIQLLLDPSIKCLEAVFEQLIKVMEACETKVKQY